jgi:hypothetical protein
MSRALPCHKIQRRPLNGSMVPSRHTMQASPAVEPFHPVPARIAPSTRWLVWVGLAVLVRLLIAAMSIGSNDALLFHTFAGEIRHFGLIETYRIDGLLNHSPLVGLWAALASWLAERFPQPFGETGAFCFIFKLPVIAADLATAWIVWKIWQARLGPHRAGAIAAAAAWSVIAILISGYHCNTDPIYAMLCLAAVYLMDDRKSFFWGGLMLAAAINVKIVPVLLIPCLLLSCGTLQDARRFVLGLSVGVIPFMPVLCFAAPSFFHNALAYNSNVNRWGINFFLMLGSHHASGAIETYHNVGRYLLFALIVAWALLSRFKPRWNRYEIGAVTFAIFLVFTPGFGIQYLAILGPMMYAAWPRMANRYALSAGAFALAIYLSQLHRAIPIYSVLGTYSVIESVIGLIVWAVVVRYMVATVMRDRQTISGPLDASAGPTGQGPVGSYTSARAA